MLLLGVEEKQVTKNGYSINDTAERLVFIQIHSEIG
jgi:hypothetical protein